jgi:hypothetical protein
VLVFTVNYSLCFEKKREKKQGSFATAGKEKENAINFAAK